MSSMTDALIAAGLVDAAVVQKAKKEKEDAIRHRKEVAERKRRNAEKAKELRRIAKGLLSLKGIGSAPIAETIKKYEDQQCYVKNNVQFDVIQQIINAIVYFKSLGYTIINDSNIEMALKKIHKDIESL